MRERGQFTAMNRLHAAEIILTHAEFGLFFEGAQMDKRFVESPAEIKRQLRAQTSELANAPMHSSL